MITMTSNYTEKKQRTGYTFFLIMIFNHMRLLDANSNKSKDKNLLQCYPSLKIV